MMKKWIIVIASLCIVVLAIFVLLVGAGYLSFFQAEEHVQVGGEEVVDKEVDTISLTNFLEKKIKYTSEKPITQMLAGNVEYKIRELCNENTNEYYYVMDLIFRTGENETENAGIGPYDVLSIGVGAVEENGIYQYSANSQLLTYSHTNKIDEGTYFLFSNDEPIVTEDMKVELFLTNQLEYESDGQRIEPHGETFRFIGSMVNGLSWGSE